MFLLISAVAHFSLATFGYNWYVKNLKKGMNPARFYEYALSSSLMIVLIGMLVGVWDLGAMIVMFGINAMMNLFGIMMELHNQTTQKDRLDLVHLWLYRRDHPVGRDRAATSWARSPRPMPSRRRSCTPSSRPSLSSSTSLP